MGDERRASGEYLVSPDELIVRSLASVGLGEIAPQVLASAKRCARTPVLPREAHAIWELCETWVVPLVAERAGSSAAERFAARARGALTVLQRMQRNREDDERRRR
jgi:hypothetical protein